MLSITMPKGIVTYVSEDLYEKFKRLCALEGSTIKDKVNELIEAWVESSEPPKTKQQETSINSTEPSTESSSPEASANQQQAGSSQKPSILEQLRRSARSGGS